MGKVDYAAMMKMTRSIQRQLNRLNKIIMDGYMDELREDLEARQQQLEAHKARSRELMARTDKVLGKDSE